MAELKERLIEACKRELDYYDVADEEISEIDYGTIIDVLFKELCKEIRKLLFLGE